MARKRFPVGAKVRKVKSNEGDAHSIGAVGVIQSYGGLARNPINGEELHEYAVRWNGDSVDTTIYDNGRLELVRSLN